MNKKIDNGSSVGDRGSRLPRVSKEDLADYNTRMARAARVAIEIDKRNRQNAIEEAENDPVTVVPARADHAADVARASALAGGKPAKDAELAAGLASRRIIDEYNTFQQLYREETSGRELPARPSAHLSNLQAQDRVVEDYQGANPGDNPPIYQTNRPTDDLRKEKLRRQSFLD